MMLKAILLVLTLAKVVWIGNHVEAARVHRDERTYAMAGRFALIGEAAQRYATNTRLLRPGVATADISVQELILEEYLPVGTSPLGPYGGDIVLVARTGAYGHVVIDMSVFAPADQAEELRLNMSVIDRGGGMVSLQAENGAARFRMAAASVANPADYLRFSGAMRAGHSLGDGSAK
ncbi:hypothetical protein [Elstera sp.]|jgi:hypothetical protein|uniref:hypothetical protein n=1 Tax=Elstera sp. TaxID=1916664 RepID=UPI0037C0827D